jgi:hypothetical protein
VLDRRPFPTLVAALAAALLLRVPVAARAQDASGATKRVDDLTAVEARRHYEEGTKAFNLGEYPRAISEFKAAYNAKPDPLLLYNIGQSFRLQGDAGQAIFFYKSFLRNMPATPNRKEVEGRIHSLEKQVQADEQHKDAVPIVVPPPATATPATIPPPPAIVATPPVEAPPPPPSTPTTSASKDAGTPAEVTPLPTAPPPLEPQPVPASAAVDLSQQPTAPPAGKPIYKKWWFWTGIGAVLLVGVVAVAARDKPPSTTFGLFDPTFVKP